MTPEERLKFASEFLSKLIDADMNLQEVREATKFAADAMEYVEREGISLEELESQSEKLAVDPLQPLSDLASTAFKTLGNLAVPVAGLALAAPYAAGRYLLGPQIARGTDKPDDYGEEIKAKELLSLLRENTATLERRKALRDGETSGNADY